MSHRGYEFDTSRNGKRDPSNGLLGATTDSSKVAAFLDRFISGGSDHTAETPVPVPHRWLDHFNLVQGGDYEAAAKADGANGHPV